MLSFIGECDVTALLNIEHLLIFNFGVLFEHGHWVLTIDLNKSLRFLLLIQGFLLIDTLLDHSIDDVGLMFFQNTFFASDFYPAFTAKNWNVLLDVLAKFFILEHLRELVILSEITICLIVNTNLVKINRDDIFV